jgi:retron-type reverse transcriptase
MVFESPKFHELKDSCLYKVQTKRKLAKFLFTSERNLQNLAGPTDRYKCWETEKKNGGTRTIEAPYDNLKLVQKRIANLLQSIQPPEYLMAPVKRRSYVDNAAVHIRARAFRLLDIEEFFPSCTEKRVFWFFNKVMFCSPDVSAILASIATRDGHLPQGSPCSPILAYFSYIDMWNQINEIACTSDYHLSIYADDITISGKTIYEHDIWAIKQILYRAGHRYSRSKERRLINTTAEITGVIVRDDSLLLPNRQHRKIMVIRSDRAAARSKSYRAKLDQQLRGRLSQAKQIYNHTLSE